MSVPLPHPAKHLHAAFRRVFDAVEINCSRPMLAGEKNVPYIAPLVFNRLTSAEVALEVLLLLARGDTA